MALASLYIVCLPFSPRAVLNAANVGILRKGAPHWTDVHITLIFRYCTASQPRRLWCWYLGCVHTTSATERP